MKFLLTSTQTDNQTYSMRTRNSMHNISSDRSSSVGFTLFLILMLVIGSFGLLFTSGSVCAGDDTTRSRTLDTDNSFATAKLITSGSSTTGTVNTTDDMSDYYKIMVQNGHGVRATLTIVDGDDDIDLILYGPGGEDDWRDYSFYDNPETVECVANASDWYYLEVYAYWIPGSGEYILNVTTVPPLVPDNNNDQPNATPVSDGSEIQETLDSLFDEVDLYKIHLTGSSTTADKLIVNMSTTSDTPGYVYIYSENNMTASQGPANTDVMFAPHQSGLYYIECYIYFGRCDYTLHVSVGSITFDGNDDIGNATLISGPGTIDGSIAAGYDSYDWYKMHLEGDGATKDVLVINFTMSSDAYITLEAQLGENGSQIVSVQTYEYDWWTGEVTYTYSIEGKFVAQETGWYYFSVYCEYFSSDYTIHITKYQYVSDGNDDPDNATTTVLDKAETGSLEEQLDMTDWYKIFLTPSGTGNQGTMVTAGLTLNPTNEADVWIYLQYSSTGDVNDLNTIAYDYTYDYQTDSCTHSAEVKGIVAEEGYYYIQLSINDGAVANYTVIISTSTVLLDGNNDFGNATQITIPYNEVHDLQKGVDPNDYYEFELAAGRTTADLLTIEVTCMANIDLQIIIYDADRIQLDSYSVSSNGTMTETVTAIYTGTYYLLVKLSSWSVMDSGEYRLKLTKETQPSDGNNHFLSATEVMNGDEIHETLDETIDKVDYFKLYLYAGEYAEILLTDMQAGCDFDLYLYDKDQNYLDSSLKGGSQDEEVSVTATGDNEGYVYIKVYMYTYSDSGPYTLKISGNASTGSVVKLTLPVNNMVRALPGAVVMEWELVTGEVGAITYSVYLSTDENAVVNATLTARVAEGLTTNKYTFTGAQDDKKYYWTVIPTDGRRIGTCANGPWSFSIAINDPPQVVSATPTGDQIMNEGETKVFTIQATDPDVDDIEQLNFQWYVDGNKQTSATGKSFTFEPDFELCDGTTPSKLVELKIKIWDPDNAIIYRTWNVTVKNVNREPIAKILLPSEGAFFNVGETITFDASYSEDPDRETLTYYWLSDLAGEIYSGDLPRFEQTLPRGIHEITLRVEDSQGAMNQTSVTIEVHGPSITIDRVIFDVEEPRANDEVTITIKVKNTGDANANSVVILVLANGDEIGREVISYIPAEGSRDISITWQPATADDYEIKVKASLGETQTEKTDSLTVLEKKKPKSSSTPGFEGVGAIAALVAISLVLLNLSRRRR